MALNTTTQLDSEIAYSPFNTALMPTADNDLPMDEREFIIKKEQLEWYKRDVMNKEKSERFAHVLGMPTAIIVAVMGILATSILKGVENGNTTDLERRKFNHNLLMKVVDAPNEERRKWLDLLQLLDSTDDNYSTALAYLSKNPQSIPNFTQRKIDESWDTVNLAVGEYRNRTRIFEAKDSATWLEKIRAHKGAWCYYQFNPAYATYGKIYNWYAVTDTAGLAPVGWHVASLDELKKLPYDYGYRGREIKDSVGWMDIGGRQGNGNNKAGLFAKPGGFWQQDIGFVQASTSSRWWTTNPVYNHPDSIYYFEVRSESDSVYWNPSINSGAGYYVRCIKNG